MSERKRIAVSGGMDPPHCGHTRMILAAAELGDVVVILNSDAWLKRKKGFSFYPTWEERAEVIRAFKGVISVEPVDDADGTVCEALERLRPYGFANGGDRKTESTPEVALCNKLGIELIWDVGAGGKVSSSSWLVDAAAKIASIRAVPADLS